MEETEQSCCKETTEIGLAQWLRNKGYTVKHKGG